VSETTSSLRAFVDRRPFLAALTALPLAWVVAVVGGLYATLARVAVSWTPGADVWFLGRDFAVFYTGGTFAGESAWPALYDLARFTERFNEITGLDLPAGGPIFRYPPPTALAFVPTAGLSLGTALVIWTLLGIAAWWAATNVLRIGPLAATIVALSIPAYSTLALGQNTFFFVAVFAAVVAAARRDWGLGVGLALGLLVFKPQLALGPIVWWLASPGRRRHLAGAVISGGTVLGVSALAAPDGWTTYLGRLSILADPGPTNRTWYFSGLDFFRMLLPDSNLAWVAWLMVTALVVVWSGRIVRRLGNDPEAGACLAVVVTLLTSPHLVAYDWLLLVVPGAVLWHRAPHLRPRLLVGGALLDLTALLGPDLAARQIGLFGRGLHPAFPVLLAVAVLVFGSVPSRTGEEAETPDVGASRIR